ncbi:hypothetical protein [Nesterenkonia pannonica]|uniref:hypothetical protein n=1 Tax=Nesterenkonia pannonica TaxID=1548602 RepID=UPI002164EC3C|nr:hypothetical protein [Nesterenkonia pannonica]
MMTATPPSGQRPGKDDQSSRSDPEGKRSRPSQSLAADARWLGWGLLAIVLTWGGFQLQLP